MTSVPLVDTIGLPDVKMQKSLTGEQMKVSVENRVNGLQFLVAHDRRMIDIPRTTAGFRSSLRFYIICEIPLAERHLFGGRRNMPFGPVTLTDIIGDLRPHSPFDEFYGMNLEQIGNSHNWETRWLIVRYEVMRWNQAEDNCVICLDPIQAGTGAHLDCGHGFHRDCIMDVWRSGSRMYAPSVYLDTHECPVCRNEANILSKGFQRRRRTRRRSKSKKRRRTKNRN